MLVYVDDILLLINYVALIDTLLRQMSEVFKIRDLGKARFFLGIEVTLCTVMVLWFCLNFNL